MMPLSLVSIDKVDAWPLQRHPGDVTILYLIKATTIDDPQSYWTFKTFRPFEAALCERAKMLNRRIWVTWRDDVKGDKRMVTCELDTSKWEPTNESDHATTGEGRMQAVGESELPRVSRRWMGDHYTK